jgi:hypothetical protein
VTHLRPAAEPAAVDLAPEHEPAADPGPQGQQHNFRAARRGTDPRLAQDRAVGVVVDHHRQPEPRGHDLVERDVVQRRVGRLDRHPRARVERARDPEADRLDLRTHGGPHLLDRIGDHLHETVLIQAVDQAVGTVMDPEVGVDRAGQELGAAEVDAYDASLDHAGTLPL